MKISILLPTCTFAYLKVCLESVVRTTDLEKCDAEVIVGMNGCDIEAIDYVKSLGSRFRYIWVDRRIGLCSISNLVAKIADGEYLVRMDDDLEILPWGCNNVWLDLLLAPFLEDSNVGQTGPSLQVSYGGYNALVGFLTMTTKKLWDQIGGLDIAFDPGMGEDADYSIKLQKNGYKLAGVPPGTNAIYVAPSQQVSTYPCWHASRVVYGFPGLRDRNAEILLKRYGPVAQKGVNNES